MGDDMSVSVEIPLDGNGFLRRECPTCEREFKRLVGEDELGADEIPDDGYYCPYCAVKAPDDQWHTLAQVEAMTAVAAEKIFDPMLSKMANEIGGRFEKGRRDPAPDLIEAVDDMRRVDFACHPAEAVKVAAGWDRRVSCPICGVSTDN
ncbi:MAG: hypothetical protein WKF96_06640 [Solirubrobacteraceae bacterium]